jgi:hypothetical protein
MPLRIDPHRSQRLSTKGFKSSKINLVLALCRVEYTPVDFLKRFFFKRDLGLSVEETLPFWTIFVLIVSFNITLTVLFAMLIIRGH